MWGFRSASGGGGTPDRSSSASPGSGLHSATGDIHGAALPRGEPQNVHAWDSVISALGEDFASNGKREDFGAPASGAMADSSRHSDWSQHSSSTMNVNHSVSVLGFSDVQTVFAPRALGAIGTINAPVGASGWPENGVLPEGLPGTGGLQRKLSSPVDRSVHNPAAATSQPLPLGSAFGDRSLRDGREGAFAYDGTPESPRYPQKSPFQQQQQQVVPGALFSGDSHSGESPNQGFGLPGQYGNTGMAAGGQPAKPGARFRGDGQGPQQQQQQQGMSRQGSGGMHFSGSPTPAPPFAGPRRQQAEGSQLASEYPSYAHEGQQQQQQQQQQYGVPAAQHGRSRSEDVGAGGGYGTTGGLGGGAFPGAALRNHLAGGRPGSAGNGYGAPGYGGAGRGYGRARSFPPPPPPPPPPPQSDPNTFHGPGMVASKAAFSPGKNHPGEIMGGRGGGPGAQSPGNGFDSGTGRGAARNEPERGQGYRKLWAQVTRVGRGDKLGESAGQLPFEDMTVEDLLRIVRSLPADESAVGAVARGLYYLDSRALAALLKELAKVGMGGRAMELFDWLRGLEPSHDLSALCDVYTYTTIVSQCGSHQQLRKALELVAEMRSRGIVLNCHAFSALMNVCIKANELELALDVFNQLLREGCTPNLVTYNILIDIYGKTGQWEEAVQVLDALEAQGTAPEVRTYNTIINACNRSGQAGPALNVYQRMLADGALPTATTYTALISAYGKTGQVDEALGVLREMVSRGCERNTVTYAALVAACERARRPAAARELFAEMQREGVKPNVSIYNSVISACSQTQDWEQAAELFDKMRQRGCKPDGASFTALIVALQAGGQWCRALQTFDRMQAQGFRADGAQYSAVLAALMAAGVLPAQLKALQLFQAALRQGILRLPTGAVSGSRDTVLVSSPGLAVLAALRWLAEGRSNLRAAAAQNPRSATGASDLLEISQLLGPVNGSLSVALTLVLSGQGQPAGNASTAAELRQAAQAALSALLAGLAAPANVIVEKEVIRLEAAGDEFKEWLASPRAALPLALVDAAAAQKLPSDALTGPEPEREAHCQQLLTMFQDMERSSCITSEPFSEPGAAARRARQLQTLLGAGNTLGLEAEVLHDAVQLLDRAACLGLLPATQGRSPGSGTGFEGAAEGADTADEALMVAAAILISCKSRGLQVGEVAMSAVLGVPAPMIGEAEQQLRSGLTSSGGGGAPISALRIMNLFLPRLGRVQDEALTSWLVGDAEALAAAALQLPALLDYPPSLVAAGTLCVARRAAGSFPVWPPPLAHATGFRAPEAGAFAAVVALITPLCRSGGLPYSGQPPPPEKRPPPPPMYRAHSGSPDQHPASPGMQSLSMSPIRLPSPGVGGSQASASSLAALQDPSGAAAALQRLSMT